MLPNSNCYSEEELIACLGGTLPDEQSRAVETHIADCEACTKIANEIKGYLLRECGSDSEGDNAMRDGAQNDAAPLDTLEPAETIDYLGQLGGYEIIRVLGRGGYGIVFEALDNVLHRNVAIKVLTRDLSAKLARVRLSITRTL